MAYANSGSRTPTGAAATCGLRGNGGRPKGGSTCLSLAIFYMRVWAFVAFPAVALSVKAAWAERPVTWDTSSDSLLVATRRWRAYRIGSTLLLGWILRHRIALWALLSLARALPRWRLHHVCGRGMRGETCTITQGFLNATRSGRASRRCCQLATRERCDFRLQRQLKRSRRKLH